MIITANGNQHEVQIEKNFSPKYDISINKTQLFNGDFYFTDIGSSSDKHYCKFKINGLTDDINALANDLYLEDSTISVFAESYEPIWGPNWRYPLFAQCIFDFKKCDIDDIKLSSIEIEVRTNDRKYVSNDKSFTPNFIKYPVKRVIETSKNGFLSISSVPFAGELIDMNTKVDGSDTPTKSEIATIEFDLKDSEANLLFSFIRQERTRPFLFSTNQHFDVFLNTNSCFVKILDFKFKPNGIGFWTFTITLLRYIQFESQQYSIAVSTSGTNKLIYTNNNGDDWNGYNQLGVNFKAIASTENSFIASTSNNRIVTSIDNFNFIDNLGFPTTDSINSIIYAENRVVCYALSFESYYSDDYGQTWSSFSTSPSSVYLSCYYDGYFYVGVKFDSGSNWQIFRSETGIDTYTLVYTADSNDDYGVLVSGDSGICLVSNFNIYTSSNGTTWSKTTTTQFVDSGGVFADGKYVFIGRDYSMVSTDLTTFTLYSLGLTGPDNEYSGISYDGKYFLTQSIRSTDGENWESMNTSDLTGTFKIASL